MLLRKNCNYLWNNSIWNPSWLIQKVLLWLLHPDPASSSLVTSFATDVTPVSVALSTKTFLINASITENYRFQKVKRYKYTVTSCMFIITHFLLTSWPIFLTDGVWHSLSGSQSSKTDDHETKKLSRFIQRLWIEIVGTNLLTSLCVCVKVE